MRIPPYVRFSISTSVAPTEAAARLEAAAMLVDGGAFHGWVQRYEFKLRPPIAPGRPNVFFPIVSGDVFGERTGSRLEGTMRPSLLVSLFLAVWTWGHLWGLLALVQEGQQTAMRWGNVMGISVMLVSGWAFCAALFLSEVRRVRQLLAEAVQVPS